MGKLSLMAPWPSIQKLILATGSMNLITLSANGSSSFVGDTVNNTKGKNKITVCVCVYTMYTLKFKICCYIKAG